MPAGRKADDDTPLWGAEVGSAPRPDYRRWALRYGMPKGIMDALKRVTMILEVASRAYASRGKGARATFGPLFEETGLHPAFQMEITVEDGVTGPQALMAIGNDLKAAALQSRLARVQGDATALPGSPVGLERAEVGLITEGYTLAVRLKIIQRQV